MDGEKYYKRFSLETRLSHILLFTTFLLLVITGFALKYSHTWLAQKVVEIMGGWEMRGYIHHISGITMFSLGIYNFLRYFLLRRNFSEIAPRFKDITDFIDYVKYHLGAGNKPKYTHFNWNQKFDYWGVVWGIIIMGITGFLMMFPFETLKFLPYSWLKIINLIHFYEALLATLVVFIWHFYHVHWNPEHPMQVQFITGKISEDMLKNEYPMDYEQIHIEENN